MDFVSWVLQRLDTLLPDASAKTAMDSPPQPEGNQRLYESLKNSLEPDVHKANKSTRRKRQPAA